MKKFGKKKYKALLYKSPKGTVGGSSNVSMWLQAGGDSPLTFADTSGGVVLHKSDISSNIYLMNTFRKLSQIYKFFRPLKLSVTFYPFPYLRRYVAAPEEPQSYSNLLFGGIGWIPQGREGWSLVTLYEMIWNDINSRIHQGPVPVKFKRSLVTESQLKWYQYDDIEPTAHPAVFGSIGYLARFDNPNLGTIFTGNWYAITVFRVKLEFSNYCPSSTS